ncbi:MAG TPA: hypothetical protein VFZ68_07750 [Acidimicrobiales bacterium]
MATDPASQARLAGVVLAVGLALAACGDSKATAAEAAASETAHTVCSMLRDWSNELSASANETASSITDDDDPATANDVLADGLEDLIDLAGDHVAAVESLDLPATRERDRLLDDLRTGAGAAVEVLEGERGDVAALPPITVERQRGAIGGLFVALEGAHAAVEPPVGSYDDETLRRAFADDEGCTHVVQPF